MKKLVSQVSRSGRDLQRYNFQGCRQVVGCITYRIRNNEKSISIDGMDQLEFLLISSQKSSKWMFPKGGWEEDETIEEAAVRETMEEAGVLGIVGIQLGNWTFKSKSQDKYRLCLGNWTFKSKSQDKYREGYMLSFRVTDELDVWPEKDSRKRIWVTASEAREKCEYLWMKMALDSFICQVNQCQMVDDEEFKISIFSASLKVDDKPTVEDIMTQSEEEEEEGDIDCHVVSLAQLQLKEENYLTPYLIRLFRNNELRIVAAQSEEENALSQLAQMSHLQMIQEDERLKPCCLDFLKSKESRFVIQLQLKEENYSTPYLIRLFRNNELRIVAAQTIIALNELSNFIEYKFKYKY